MPFTLGISSAGLITFHVLKTISFQEMCMSDDKFSSGYGKEETPKKVHELCEEDPKFVLH